MMGKPVYRCPYCLTTKITEVDLGGQCPGCFKDLPKDLQPIYEEKESAFRGTRSIGKISKPQAVAGLVLIIVALGYFTSLDKSKNLSSSSNSQSYSSKSQNSFNKLFSFRQSKPISFAEVKSSLDFLKFVSQSKWDVYTGGGGNPYVKVGKINQNKVANPEAFREVMMDNIDLYTYLGETDAYKYNKEYSKYETSDRRTYPDLVDNIRENKVVKITLFSSRGVCLAYGNDGSVYGVNLPTDSRFLQLLSEYNVEISVPRSDVETFELSGAAKIKAHEEKIQLFFEEHIENSENPKRFRPVLALPSELFGDALVGSTVYLSYMKLELRTDGKVHLKYNY